MARLTAGVSAAALAVSVPAVAFGVTSTSDLTTLSATDLADTLGGGGVSVSNVTYTGDPTAAGTFDGGDFGFSSGVILASGTVANAIGPNTVGNKTSNFGLGGDADLTALAGFSTNDAAVLEFDFVPDGDTVYFRYVFASEEYNEYVNTSFNDVFAFFVNGENCAVVDDGAGGTTPISVNTINNGNPVGDPTATNPHLYRDNTANAFNTEYDGLTIVLTCMAPVNNGELNHMKLAIADGSDHILDAGVFLEQGSLSTTPPGIGKVTGGGRVDMDGGFTTLGTTVISDEQGLRGNLQVNDHRSGDRFHGYSVDGFSTTDNTATWSGEGRWNGEDGYEFEITVVDNRNGNAAKKGDPDTVELSITQGGSEVWGMTTHDLTRGNITVHQEE